MLDNISRFRRLSRAVTTQSGALDTSFLGLGRPLGSARVLNAIGHGKTEVSDLREYLELDSGLMSRLLRGLEAEGLITVESDGNDARRRVAQLTPEGRNAFHQYESLSNSAAEKVLSRYKDQDSLLAAMDLIATVLGRDHIKIAPVDPEDPRIEYCVNQFYDEITSILGIPFDPHASGNPEADYLRPPKGVFLLATSDGLPIGCCGLKGQGTHLGEVKRLWLSSAARGLGLGKRLMDEIEDHARKLGMTTLQLDTNGRLHAALGLYRNSGWIEIDRYNDNPYAEHFFEKQLT